VRSGDSFQGPAACKCRVGKPDVYNPLRRVAEPEEIAGASVLVALRGSSSSTGHNVIVGCSIDIVDA
jgi:hypothetical protein